MIKIFVVIFVFALLAIVKSDIIITQPIQSSNWNPGSVVPITWLNKDRRNALSGNLIIDLMEGSDSSNLSYVLTIKDKQDASANRIPYKVPGDLPKSQHYTLRFTTDSGDQFYSTPFKGGSGEQYSGQMVTQTAQDMEKVEDSDSKSSADSDSPKGGKKNLVMSKTADSSDDSGSSTYSKDSDETSKPTSTSKSRSSSQKATSTDSDSDSDGPTSTTSSSKKTSDKPNTRAATDNIQLLSSANKQVSLAGFSVAIVVACLIFA
ncbi:hypothetical protein BB560_006749 [Smittium megazygosporum]|uniref:Yeast cell wall synthesis Kre9/Knh1-like N-terminal domain-containing protein n=1 Tax=Smittium megazygosporum TaxID=133381 RepID=A0A2T9Y200_9FUNG|nr:hypothetical protein BB560_006749 [Smittium megazygosporum]